MSLVIYINSFKWHLTLIFLGGKMKKYFAKELIAKVAGLNNIAEAVKSLYRQGKENLGEMSIEDFLNFLPLKDKWRILDEKGNSMAIGFSDGSKLLKNESEELICF